jgi:hypothetical protein
MEPQDDPAREAPGGTLRDPAAPWLQDLLSQPAMAAAAPSQVEVVVVSAAIYLFGLVFPLAVFVFSAINLRRGSEARVLFVSAMISSGVALLSGLLIWLLPAARPQPSAAQDWRGFALVFVYAWALLDFWRGARLTRARPRGPAAVAALCLVAVAFGVTLAAT